MSIAIKCVDWNAARYDQVFNYELAVKLLLEELEELHTAKTLVDKLDAIGDVTFVAIGVLWKLGFTKEELHSFFYDYDIRVMLPMEAFDYMSYLLQHTTIKLSSKPEGNEYGSFSAVCFALHAVFIDCLLELHALKMQGAFYDIVDAICNSNNTKEVKCKTDPAIKANIVKGDAYVHPSQDLLEIAQAYVHIIPERY